MENITFIRSVSELHEIEEIHKPVHPLISVHYFDINDSGMSCCKEKKRKYVLDLYQIVLDECIKGKLRYGRSSYDFEEGSLIFLKPGQLFYSDSNYVNYHSRGWALSFHPDLIRQTELGAKIEDYSFFSYEANEALHLSDKEKSFLFNIVKNIEAEYNQNIDEHSHELINSNLRLLLDYSKRYYNRQFYTRTPINKGIAIRFELLLKNYYEENKQFELGVPTVKYCGEELQLSPNYLSDLLKKETGRSAMDHIHYFLIEKAKAELLHPSNSIGQVAYELGFEHTPYFSKLFKKRTGTTPKGYILASGA